MTRCSYALCLALCLLVAMPARAQADSLRRAVGMNTHTTPILRASYLGLGGVVLSDSYLSPLNYGGYTIHFASETAQWRYRGRGLGGLLLGRGYAPSPAEDEAPARWLRHRLVSVDYSSTTNPTGSGTMLRLQARWEAARLYKLYDGSLGRILLGPGYTAGVGGLYNSRNGNNPATLKLDASLTLALHYSYRLPWHAFPMQVRLATRTDLIGTQWSQQFGESYYEMYYVSGEFGKRFGLMHLGNQLGVQIRLAIDLPLFRHTDLSIAYRLQHRRWEINHLITRQSDHTLSLGLVRYIRALAPREVRQVHPTPF